MTGYAIRGGAEGTRRLDLLAHIMGPSTAELLAEAGIRVGDSCLDVGCGGGHVTQLLARLVGPAGRVVGVDIDQVKIATAQAAAAEAGLSHATFRVGNVTQLGETTSYDLVYCRFILSHLPDPTALVQRFAGLVRVPGRLVLEDIDFGGAFCHPPNQAYRRYCELYEAVVQRRGGDARLGCRLVELCQLAGLGEIAVRVVHPAHTGSVPEKALMLSTLINIRDAVLAEGLASAHDLDGVIADLQAFTNDPRSLIGLPRVVQVWARRFG
jgi:SAM-dependent methyltransferase